MKKLYLIFGIIFLSGLNFWSSSVFAHNVGLHKNEQNENISYLFIQSADIAQIELVDSRAGLYQLTLKNVQPFTSYFSDRPQRMTGLMPINQFIDLWHKGANSFAKVPPNVGLAGNQVPGASKHSPTSLIVELTHPKYDAQKKRLLYDMKFVSPLPSFILNKKILYNVSLFFDNFVCPGCCCGNN